MMKKLTVAVLILLILPSVIFAAKNQNLEKIKPIAEMMYGNLPSKYSFGENKNTEKGVEDYINEYPDDIIMAFKPGHNYFVQDIDNSNQITLFPDTLEIHTNRTFRNGQIINVKFQMDKYNIEHAGETVTIAFENNNGILTPVNTDDWLDLVLFLSYGTGYIDIYFNTDSRSSIRADIYYFDLLYCMLWMNEQILPDKGWFELLK